MTPAEELSQIRRGLAGQKADLQRFAETMQANLEVGLARIDEMAAEVAARKLTGQEELVKDLIAKARFVTRNVGAGGSEDYRALGDLEKALDAMETEATKPGPLESTEVRPDFFSKNEPHTFEERVGDAPYADTPWRISEDGDRIVECARGGDTGTFTTKEDARWVVNIANNWDRIVELIEAARQIGHGFPPSHFDRVNKALAALDAAEVVT